MQREVLDALRREMLFRDVPRGAADAQHGTVVVEHHARVDPDPAFFAGRGDDPGHVMLDLTVALELREEPPIRHVRRPGLEVEEAAPDEVLRRNTEDHVGGGIEIGEAAEGIGGPDEVVRGLDQIAVAVLALQQELDDAPLLRERLADGRKFLAGLVAGRGEGGAGEAVDKLARIAAVPAMRAARHQHSLLVPTPQLLDRNAEHLGHLLDAVFRRRIAHGVPSVGHRLFRRGLLPRPVARWLAHQSSKRFICRPTGGSRVHAPARVRRHFRAGALPSRAPAAVQCAVPAASSPPTRGRARIA